MFCTALVAGTINRFLENKNKQKKSVCVYPINRLVIKIIDRLIDYQNNR